METKKDSYFQIILLKKKFKNFTNLDKFLEISSFFWINVKNSSISYLWMGPKVRKKLVKYNIVNNK